MSNIIELLGNGDAPWKTAMKLLALHERSETCLGYRTWAAPRAYKRRLESLSSFSSGIDLDLLVEKPCKSPSVLTGVPLVQPLTISCFKTLRDLNRELANFSLPRFDTPLLEIKKSPVGVQVSGYASTFGPPPDAQNEIVDYGAFSATIEQHRRAGAAPVMLFGHDQNKPIGIWTGLVEDGRGLHVNGTILSTVRKGREAIALLEAKSIDGLSIGFRCKRDKMIGGIRHIQEADLIEISLCAVPAANNPRLAITGKEL
jgi:uncharacterized protein